MVYRFRPNKMVAKIEVPETDIDEMVSYMSELWGKPTWQDGEFVGNNIWCLSTIHQLELSDGYTVTSLAFNPGPALNWALLKWGN
jgi:hypothetical protein